jgi:hypothetical protein
MHLGRADLVQVVQSPRCGGARLPRSPARRSSGWRAHDAHVWPASCSATSGCPQQRNGPGWWSCAGGARAIVLADRETSAVVFKPSTTASPPLVDQLRGADCRARGGPHDRAHRLAPALVRNADHSCGREGLRVPEVGIRRRCDHGRIGRRWKATSATCRGHHHGRHPRGRHVREPWTCCSAAGHQRSCSRSTRTRRSRCPIPSLLAHRLRRRQSAAQQTHTAFARVLTIITPRRNKQDCVRVSGAVAAPWPRTRRRVAERRRTEGSRRLQAGRQPGGAPPIGSTGPPIWRICSCRHLSKRQSLQQLPLVPAPT